MIWIRLLSLLLLVLLAQGIIASYHNISHPFLSSVSHRHERNTRRWYSVKPLKPQVSAIDQGKFGPWPSDEHSHHLLQYCFEDARSHRRLTSIVDEAVSRLHGATIGAGASSLRIVPSNKNNPLCDDNHKADDDALHIKDDTRDDSDEDIDATHWNLNQCSTQTTVGYDYHGTSIGRNSMKFCEFTPGASRTRIRAPLFMMHELGHAMGLAHEHQRPDRDKHIGFACSNIDGYDRAKLKQLLADDEAGLFDHQPKASNPPVSGDPEIKDRLNQLCKIEEVARAYFPRALEYIRGDMTIASDERWRNYARSTPFDFESIMMYDSDNLGKEDPQKPGTYRWVIFNKDTNAKSQRLYMGGSSGSISRGDIARVAQLYPLADGGNIKAQDFEQWAPTEEVDEFSPAIGDN